MMSENVEKMVNELLTRLGKRGYDKDEVEAEIAGIIDSEFEFLQDPQFETEDDKIRFAIRVAGSRMLKEPPVKPIELLFLGCIPPIYLKTGKFRGEAYGIDSTGIRQIRLDSVEQFEYLNDLESFTTYEIMLGIIKTQDGSTFFSATSKISAEVIDTIEGREDKIRVAKENSKFVDKLDKLYKIPSKTNKFKTKDKRELIFVDHSDLRLVKGIIMKSFEGKRKDGKPMHYYHITDTSLAREFITKKGRYHPRWITCWSTKIEWADESYCYFLGSSASDENGIPTMNIVATIPEHASPRIHLME